VPPQGKPQTITADELFAQYLTTHHRLRRVIDEAMSGCGLALTRTKALEYLRTNGPVQQRELALLFGYAPRSITDLIDGLERDGLAIRTDDPRDRRAKLVAVTPAGIAAAASAMTVRNQLIEQVFGSLTEADRVQFHRLLILIDTAAAVAPQPSF
jgi:DNA-binding MarR family transcriptional regulator